MFIVPVSRRASANVRGFDRLFDDALERLFTQPATSDASPARRPAIDVGESDAGYVVTLDVPGVTREDVKVSIDGRRVSIVAEARAAEAAPDGAEAPKAEARVVLRERAPASYARSFTLQSEIDQSSSQARLENGVLTLTLTKRHASAAQLTVN
jgi:HSP20 family protein